MGGTSTQYSARSTVMAEKMWEIDVPVELIDDLVLDPIAISALDALDIDREDHAFLSEILDPDCGGTISVCELVEGVRKLRGLPRRSDMVTQQLMIRTVQSTLYEVRDMLQIFLKEC